MLEKISNFKYLARVEKYYHYLKKLEPSKYSHFLKKEYQKRTGEKLDLEQPKKYTEKMQYAKIYLNTPLKTKLSDKLSVREWIENEIGNEYLIPLLGVWDKFSDINIKELPNSFVLKSNSGAGKNIIVSNKEEFNYTKAKLKFNYWMSRNSAFTAVDIQPHYADIEPKILAEEYTVDSKGELNDYKFLCFDGKVYYCWLDVGRFSTHYRNVYDIEWNLQPWNLHPHVNTPYQVEKPENFEKMVELAERLSRGFSHVRVDLYNVDGKIFFGEMTFTSAGGYKLIVPEKYNYMLGDLWNLEENNSLK